MRKNVGDITEEKFHALEDASLERIGSIVFPFVRDGVVAGVGGPVRDAAGRNLVGVVRRHMARESYMRMKGENGSEGVFSVEFVLKMFGDWKPKGTFNSPR